MAELSHPTSVRGLHVHELVALGQDARLLPGKTVSIVHLLETEAEIILEMRSLLYGLTEKDEWVCVGNHDSDTEGE